MDGGLPWRVPADRRAFESITRNKVLIIGRYTLLEGANNGNFDHISHCRRVIVVSRTLLHEEVLRMTQTTVTTTLPFPTFHVAPSVTEAIQLAQHIGRKETNRCPDERNDATPWYNMDYWVGGGEGVYTEALALSQARFLHLTHMNTSVPTIAGQKVAYFPSNELWESNYRLVSQIHHSTCDPISFVTNIYQRTTPPR